MSDDGKSFRERVEEIRQERAEASTSESSDSQIKVSVNQTDGAPSMDFAPGEMGLPGMDQEQWQGARVWMELGNEVLEFTDATVIRNEFGENVLYGVPETPDGREGQSGSSSDPESPGGDHSDADTTVYTASDGFDGGGGGGSDRSVAGGGSGGSSPSVNFCPGCGVDLSSISGASFCPECGDDLPTG